MVYLTSSSSDKMASKHIPLHSQTPTSKMSDEELKKLGTVDIIKRLRKTEADNIKLMIDHGAMMKEVNCRMQVHLMEIRGLKEVNQRLQDDNQELRDLCCFLDDDRQKGRKLAREWQRFGRYTASVMRQEVSTYQTKLRELENKQQELIKDNLELKELCLYLDEERNVSRSSLCGQCGSLLHGPRDEGDGSSSSTNTDEPLIPVPPPPPTRCSSRERLLEESIQRQRNIINEQILHYIRSLKIKIRQLENEKSKPDNKRTAADGEKIFSPPFRQEDSSLTMFNQERPIGVNDYHQTTKPETIVHAMKVLEVHDQLNTSHPPDCGDIGQGERALVREMCNVVWRKLEDGQS